MRIKKAMVVCGFLGWFAGEVPVARAVDAFGISSAPTGQAITKKKKKTTQSSGGMIVTNIGSSGQDGVGIYVATQRNGSDNYFWDGSIDAGIVPVGGFIKTTTTSDAGGTTALTATRLATDVSLTSNFSNVSNGSPLTIDYYTGGPGGTLVYSENYAGTAPQMTSIDLPATVYVDLMFHPLRVTRGFDWDKGTGAAGDMTAADGTFLPASDQIDFVDITVPTDITPQYSAVNITAGGGITSFDINNEVVATPAFIWVDNGPGPFDTGSNWSGGIAPGSGQTANFLAAAADTTVTLQSNVTLAGITFNSSSHYTLGGGASYSITLNGGATPAMVYGQSGAHTIAAPVILASNVNVETESGTQLTFSGPVTGTGSLLVDGEGTVVLSGTSTYTGTTEVDGIESLGSSGQDGPTCTLELASTGSLVTPSISIGINGMFVADAGSHVSSTTALLNNGTVSFNGPAVTIGTLNGTGAVALNSTLLTVTGGGTFSGTLVDGTSPGGLAVTSGSLTLLGTNTYTGPTNISGGVLIVGPGGTIPPSSVVFVTGGAVAFSNTTQTIANLLGTGGTVSVGSTALTVTSGGSYSGSISGNTTGSINISGGLLTFSGVSSFPGTVNVLAGSLNIAASGRLPATTISVASGATLTANGSLAPGPVLTVAGTAILGANVGTTGPLVRNFSSISVAPTGAMSVGNSAAHTNRTVITTGSLTFTGATSGVLDLGSNDLDIRSGSLATVTQLVAQGFEEYGDPFGCGCLGQGIVSSTANTSTTHILMLGVLQNNQNGTPLFNSANRFSTVVPGSADILIKFTYFGDANLDGRVASSDYTQIDNGYLSHLTGWFNGDFNYDGIVNGTDYTLIDNAFNTQGAQLTSQISEQTVGIAAQIEAVAAVPEPSGLLLLVISYASLSLRRRRLPVEIVPVPICRPATL